MVKLGIEKGKDKVEKDIKSRLEDHDHVPGVAFDIMDTDSPAAPVDQLIHVVGGGFFNEPKYYDSNRSDASFMSELSAKGKISSVIRDEHGLSEQAYEVIEAITSVCESENPEDILIVANWVRNGLNIRTTPAIMVAIAAHYDGSKKFVKKYTPHILVRADDIIQAFAAYRHFFNPGKTLHKGTVAASLRKGLVAAFQKQDVTQLIKYDNSTSRPNFADVLKMIRTDKVGGHNAVSKPVFKYFVNGEVPDDAPQVLIDRKNFWSSTEFNSDLIPVAKRLGLTWNNLKSHFPESQELWESMIDNKILPYMATLKNLRNMEQAGISLSHWRKVSRKLRTETDHRQLPFRFWSAYKAVTKNVAKDAVSIALDNSISGVTKLPGRTMILVDNSGSAVGAAVSENSELMVSDAGNMLAAIGAKSQGVETIVAVFGDECKAVSFTSNEPTMTIKERLDQVGQTVGEATETGAWVAIDGITKKNIFVDRVLFLSDMCAYTSLDESTSRGEMPSRAALDTTGFFAGQNCGRDLSKYGFFSRNTSLPGMFATYRRKVNPNFRVYSVNLAGYSQAQADPEDPRTSLLSGWNEAVFDLISQIEGKTRIQDQQVEKPRVKVPTIEVLREQYTIK